MKTCTRSNVFFAAAALFVFAAATIFAADSAAPAPTSANPPAKPPNYNERYGVLSERNIFLRERGVRPARSYGATSRDSSSYQATRPPPEAAYVLTGIVLEDGLYRAYVEDTSTGRVHRLAVGDSIARGHVLEIEIDAIAYDLNGRGTWITPGSDLRGQPFSGFPTALSRYMAASTNPSSSSGGSGGGGGGFTTGPSASGGGGSGGGVAPPPLDPNTAGLSVEERMRLRRLQGK
jgi:hypothetical protein